MEKYSVIVERNGKKFEFFVFAESWEQAEQKADKIGFKDAYVAHKIVHEESTDLDKNFNIN